MRLLTLVGNVNSPPILYPILGPWLLLLFLSISQETELLGSQTFWDLQREEEGGGDNDADFVPDFVSKIKGTQSWHDILVWYWHHNISIKSEIQDTIKKCCRCHTPFSVGSFDWKAWLISLFINVAVIVSYCCHFESKVKGHKTEFSKIFSCGNQQTLRLVDGPRERGNIFEYWRRRDPPPE